MSMRTLLFLKRGDKSEFETNGTKYRGTVSRVYPDEADLEKINPPTSDDDDEATVLLTRLKKV